MWRFQCAHQRGDPHESLGLGPSLGQKSQTMPLKHFMCFGLDCGSEKQTHLNAMFHPRLREDFFGVLSHVFLNFPLFSGQNRAFRDEHETLAKKRKSDVVGAPPVLLPSNLLPSAATGSDINWGLCRSKSMCMHQDQSFSKQLC